MLIAIPQTRSPFLKGIANVSEAFFIPRLLLPLACYFAYSGLIVFAGYRFGLWDFSLTKDTIIAVCFVGLPILFNQVSRGTKLFRQVLLETIGASALIVFYLNLEPLPLAGELIAQPVIAFSVLLSTVGSWKEETRKVGGCFRNCAFIMTIGLMIFTTVQVITKWNDYQWGPVVASFALSIWFPFALLPFIYIFSFITHCESVLVMLPRFSKGQRPKLRTRVGFLLGLHLSSRYAALFTGKWRGKIAQEETFTGALSIMRKFRNEVRQRAGAEKARIRRLKQNAGVQGTDDQGFAFDRREFYETKKALDSLFYYQMASKRNNGKYRADLLDIFGYLASKDLPEDHGIKFRLRKDQSAWYVWRMTPSGWFFGIGGTPNVDEKWTYFGDKAPAVFPTEDNQNWFNELTSASCDEWVKDDRPISSS